MITPHEHGDGAYKDLMAGRTILEEEENLITNGYKFLGWVNGWGDDRPKEYVHCLDEAHNYYSAFPNVWKSVRHTHSGSDTTQWCTKCKIYWKVDMS